MWGVGCGVRGVGWVCVCECACLCVLVCVLQAAAEGDLETIMTCLAYRGNLLWAEPGTGTTAMHLACAHGQVVAAEFLLQNGASLAVTDAAGHTPLQAAEAAAQVRPTTPPSRVLCGCFSVTTPGCGACKSGGMPRGPPRCVPHARTPPAHVFECVPVECAPPLQRLRFDLCVVCTDPCPPASRTCAHPFTFSPPYARAHVACRLSPVRCHCSCASRSLWWRG